MLLFSNDSFIVDGVTVFPDHESKTDFWFLPAPVTVETQPGGSADSQGTNPEFRLIEYAPDDASGPAQGTGFLEVTLCLKLSDETRAKIISTLRKDPFNVDEPLLSQVSFDEGTVQIIALDLQGGGGTSAAPPVVGSGTAVQHIYGASTPELFGNNDAVFSVLLSPEGISILEAALGEEMTPVGGIYSLKFTGVEPALDVKITCDLKRAYQSFSVDLTASVYWVSVGIDATFEKLRQEGAIKVEVVALASDDATKKAEDWALSLFKDKLMTDWFEPSLSPEKAKTADASSVSLDNDPNKAKADAAAAAAAKTKADADAKAATSADAAKTKANDAATKASSDAAAAATSASAAAATAKTASDAAATKAASDAATLKTTTDAAAKADATTKAAADAAVTTAQTAATKSASDAAAAKTKADSLAAAATKATSDAAASKAKADAATGAAAGTATGAAGGDNSAAAGVLGAIAGAKGTAFGASSAASPIGVALRLKYVQQDELKTLEIDYNQMNASQRTYSPQGFLGAMLTNAADRSKLVLKVDGNDPFYSKFSVVMNPPKNFAAMGLTSIHVSLDYGDAATPGGPVPKHGDFIFDATTASQSWEIFKGNIQLNQYQWAVDYAFDPDSGWVGEQVSYSLPPRSTTDRVLTLDPHQYFSFLNVTVRPNRIDPIVDRIETLMESTDPDGWQTSNTMVVQTGTPQQKWMVRSPIKLDSTSPAKAPSYTYTSTCFLKDGTVIPGQPVKGVASALFISDPFVSGIDILIMGTFSSANYQMAIIEIMYSDPAVNYNFSTIKQLIAGAPSSPDNKIHIPILDRTKSQCQYRITMVDATGAKKQGAFTPFSGGPLIVDGN